MASSIAVTAIGRRKKLMTNDPSIYAAGAPSVSRVSRDSASNADALQIRIRQRAEQIPEGDVRRPGKRKSKSSY